MWIWIGVGVVVVIYLLLWLSRPGPKDMDEEAMHEAAEASPEELEHVLHPPPKTKEQIEEENEYYIEK